MTTDEAIELENCEAMDLGDPFEEYDGVTSKFDYGDKNMHKLCVKSKDKEGPNRPDEQTLLKLQEEKKAQLIEEKKAKKSFKQMLIAEEAQKERERQHQEILRL